MIAVVEEIDVTGESKFVEYNLVLRGNNYDLVDQNTKKIVYSVKEAEPQHLGGDEYIVEIR